MNKSDALLTFDSVIQWSESTSGSIAFKIAGCILFLLFLKAGSSFYPDIDGQFLENWLDQTDSCGWNSNYEKLTVKYSKELLQTKPNVPRQSRGSTLHSPKKSSIRFSKEECLTTRKRSRHHSDDHSDGPTE